MEADIDESTTTHGVHKRSRLELRQTLAWQRTPAWRPRGSEFVTVYISSSVAQSRRCKWLHSSRYSLARSGYKVMKQS